MPRDANSTDRGSGSIAPHASDVPAGEQADALRTDRDDDLREDDAGTEEEPADHEILDSFASDSDVEGSPAMDEDSSSAEPDEIDEADDWDAEIDGEPGSFRSAVTAEFSRRAEMSMLKGMEHVAETFEETAHRISRLARLRGGPEALSIGPVHSTVGWLEGAADYLRSSDLEAVQSDLRHRVRARPVQSLGIALCAGWVIGRILR